MIHWTVYIKIATVRHHEYRPHPSVNARTSRAAERRALVPRAANFVHHPCKTIAHVTGVPFDVFLRQSPPSARVVVDQ